MCRSNKATRLMAWPIKLLGQRHTAGSEERGPMHRTIASVFTFAVLVFGTVAPAAAAAQGSPECPNQVGGQLTIDNTGWMPCPF